MATVGVEGLMRLKNSKTGSVFCFSFISRCATATGIRRQTDNQRSDVLVSVCSRSWRSTVRNTLLFCRRSRLDATGESTVCCCTALVDDSSV